MVKLPPYSVSCLFWDPGIIFSNDTYFRADTLCKDVTVALVGKYTKLEDAYASVTKALQHAAVAAGFRLKIKVQSKENLCSPNTFHLVSGFCNYMYSVVFLMCLFENVCYIWKVFLCCSTLRQLIWKKQQEGLIQSHIMKLGKSSAKASKFY